MHRRAPARDPWAGPFLAAVPALLLASWFAAAADESAVPRPDASAGAPSTFDYLVLASLADSPQLHAMAGFRSSAGRRVDSKPAPEVAQDRPLRAEDWRR